jgi:hypothetical protein
MSESSGDILVRALFAASKCMKGARFFVRAVIRKLQQRVKQSLIAQAKNVDCGGCSSFDVGHMQLAVSSLSPEGVFTTIDPHCFDQAQSHRSLHPVAVTFANVPPCLSDKLTEGKT